MNRRMLLKTGLAAPVVFSAGLGAAAAQAVRWKAVATSRPTPHFELWTWLATELEKRTNGQVKTDVISLPEIGLTGFELVRVTRAGLVDIADVILVYVAGDVPALEGVDLPGLYPDFETSVKAHAAFLPALKKHEDKLGGVVLGAYLWPDLAILSKKPIRSLADMKGLKIRAFGTAVPDYARALGAEPVAITFAELYTALERCTVDAGFTSTFTGFNVKLYEVAKYIVEINIGPASGALVVSKRTWDKLTPEVRRILTKLGEEFTEKGWDYGRRTSKEGTQKMIEKGMVLLPTDPALAAASRDAVRQAVVPGYVKRAGPEGKALFNQYLAPYSGFTIP